MKGNKLTRWTLALFLGVALPLVHANASEPKLPEKPRAVRFEEDPIKGSKLQTAIITLENAKGQTVHLVGSIHIADKAYYKELSGIFAKYDALCFELIMPQDMDVKEINNPDRGAQLNAVSLIQRFMKNSLELQHQLDGIDYTAKNFVHADLSAEEFEKLQSKNNESLFTLFLRQVIHQMNNPGAAANANISLPQLIMAMNSPDRADQLKLVMGKMMGQVEEETAILQGTVLLTERNKKAVQVAKKTLAQGKKEIGIFYGAAHLQGIQELLEADGFKPTKTQWITAWDIPVKAPTPK